MMITKITVLVMIHFVLLRMILIVKKKYYDGDDDNDGVVSTSNDNISISTTGGTRDVRDELVKNIGADKVVDSAMFMVLLI
ncbi:conserved hypothetical protein [Ricinus communis]|uniref:Uncharacterized protein n=1 Tax=Ricinus communis TaxID=3988 RepID=B9SR06_RICCO|nr:conserved hypothetical protein [Ricinus communis]